MTNSIMKPRRKHYAGFVIDGPFEGEFIESDEAYFVGHYPQPVTAFYTDLPACPEERGAFYMWLRTYRAWVWMQPYTRKAKP